MAPKKTVLALFVSLLMGLGFVVGFSPAATVRTTTNAAGERVDLVGILDMLMGVNSVYNVYVSSPLQSFVLLTPNDNYVTPTINLPVRANVVGDGTEQVRFAANIYGDPFAFPEGGFQWFGNAYSDPPASYPFQSTLDLGSFLTGNAWNLTSLAVYALVNTTVVNTETATLTYEDANEASQYLPVWLLQTDGSVDSDKNCIPDSPLYSIGPQEIWTSDQIYNGDLRTVTMANLAAGDSVYGSIVVAPSTNVTIECPTLEAFQNNGAIGYGESGFLMVETVNELYGAIDQVYGGGDVYSWAQGVAAQQPGVLVTGGQFIQISLVYSVYTDIYGSTLYNQMDTLPDGLCINVAMADLYESASDLYRYPAQIVDTGDSLIFSSAPDGGVWSETYGDHENGVLTVCTNQSGIFAPMIVPRISINHLNPNQLPVNTAADITITGIFPTLTALNALQAAAAYTVYVGGSPASFADVGGVAITPYANALNDLYINVPGISVPGDYDVTVADNINPNNVATVYGGLAILPQTYDVRTGETPAEGGSTSGGGTFLSGNNATVVATPNEGYAFVYWAEGTNSVSASAIYTFTVNADVDLVANFDRITYGITTSASPPEGGSTSGDGTFNSGDEVTVVGTPADGYTFANWTEGAAIVSTSEIYSFLANENADLAANFDRITYTVGTSASPSEGGSTSGGGTVNSGDDTTVVATPAANYTFANWTEGASIVSASDMYTFAVTGNVDLVANFDRITYNVSTSASPSEGGSTSGGGTVNSGDDVTVVATPAATYAFVSWTEDGNVVSTDASYTFTASGNRDLVANFVIITYTIATSASPAAAGSTSGAGTYVVGDSVTVTATGSLGYRFTNWTEGASIVSTSATYTFTAAANRNLVANFVTTPTYTVNTSSSPAAGGATSGGGTFNSGSSVTVVATPTVDYTFTSWKVGSTVVSTSPSYTFTLTANRNLVATFTRISYTVSTSASPAAGGSTSGGGTVNSGASTTVHATANTGYSFANWTDAGGIVSTSANYTFAVTGDRALVANFVLNTYSISANASPAAGGSISGAGTYTYGDNATLVATPNSDYNFTSWKQGSTVVSTSPSYSFTVTGNRTLVATFTIKTYAITTSSSPAIGGATSGGGTKNSGTSVTVKANPGAGYVFIDWTEGGVEVSTAANYTFTVSADRSLVANFARITYTVTTSASPAEGGSASGDGTVNSGDPITVVATPAANYRFVKWTNFGSTASLSTSASYTFTPTANRTLVANFALITYSITATASPSAGGTVTGAGTKNSGDTVTLVAAPKTNYHFVNWTEGGVEVSTSATYTFTASANRTLVANFAFITYTISASASPSVGGSTTGGGTVNSGANVTVKATAATGYAFVNWTEDGVVESTSANYTFAASANRTLVANFYSVTALTMATPVTGGQPSSGMVTISPAAGAGGVTVTLSSNNAALTVAATVLVPEGATTAAVNATTTTVTSGKNVTVKAAIGASNKSVTVRVNP